MLEYLILNGKFEAAKHLNATLSTSLREELVNHFNKGNREDFMDIYNMLHKQSKLEFYLRVYFLIYSIHPALRGKTAIPEPQKIAFKDYLDNRGSELAKTNEFLEFYALPFIKKPLQHINFKNLFKKQWVTNLKQKLQIFITEEERILKAEIAKVFQTSHQLSSPQGSVLIESKNLQDKVKQMEKINKKLFEEVTEFADKYHILEDNHKLMMEGYHTQMMQSQSKWFQITKQLVQCSKTFIEMLISTDSDFVADRRFLKLKKRTEKYERFVNKRFDDLVSHSQDISIFDKPSISDMSYSVTPHTQKNFHSNPQISTSNVEAYIPTDYQALKVALKKSNPQQKISILNGFFWRILKSKSKEVRRLNILGMLHYDVLGIKTNEIQPLLASRQFMRPIIRLIQLISFDNFGKCLAFNSTLLKDMVGLVMQCQDETCFENIICIIAQISSERPFKIRLINEGIIEVCMAVLRNKKYHTNQIVLENTTAIMLNMLEKPEGSRKFQKQRDLFEVLKTCLTLNFKIPRSLIYGIIFSLLENEQLFKLAHAQHMPQFFASILKIDPHISKVQLSYLKNKLSKFQPKPKQQQQEDDANQEFDYNQLEQDEEIQVEDQYISELDDLVRAHDELVKKFGLKGKDGERQTKQIKQIYDEYIENKLPHFNIVEQIKVSKVSSPASKLRSSQLQKIQHYQSPSLRPLPTQQPQKSTEKPSTKKNNFVEPSENVFSNNNANLYSLINQNTNENSKNNPNVHARPKERASKFADEKQKQTKQKQRKQEQFEILSDERKMKKSVSADRGIGRNIENSNKIYQSNRFSNNQKVSEFRHGDDRSFRSPQQQKRPREEVLKQLNQQIKAEQRRKQQTQNRRQNVNTSLYASERQPKKGQEGEVFQSRPKLRRTPPRE